jgi:hypothetical protein
LKHTLNFMTVCSKDKIKLPSFVLFLGILLMLASCRKNEDTVGSDFIDDLVGFDEVQSDSATIVSYTSVYDSIPTKTLSYYILGNMNDPELGTSTAAIITQLDLPAQQYAWATPTITIDSIVLQIDFASTTGYYGNRNSAQTFKVYEITEALPNTSDDIYFSNRSYVKSVAPIGTWTGSFSESQMTDSITYTYNGVYNSLAPQIRIKLDDPTFVEKFKNANQGHFVSTADFQSYIKGLMVLPETSPLNPGEGSVAYMNMNNSATTVVVYYGNGTQRADFPIYSSNCIKANKYSHVHNVTVPVQPLMGGTNKTTNYLQPLTGLKTRITFPNLFDYVKDNKIAITGAEMIFTVDNTKDTSVYKLPPQIRLLASDSVGRNDFILDFNNLDGTAYYGGYYNSSTGEYRFNIVRQIQYILSQYKNNNKNVNYGLNLIVQADNPIAANRVILDTSPGKIKLKLSYTVIK